MYNYSHVPLYHFSIKRTIWFSNHLSQKTLSLEHGLNIPRKVSKALKRCKATFQAPAEESAVVYYTVTRAYLVITEHV